MCRYQNNCQNVNCEFQHPPRRMAKPCHFQKNCQNDQCRFLHFDENAQNHFLGARSQFSPPRSQRVSPPSKRGHVETMVRKNRRSQKRNKKSKFQSNLC